MRPFVLIVGSLLMPAALWAQRPPAQLLTLTNWKLTLPVDTEHAGSPDEIRQPELASFVEPSAFFVSPDGRAVLFRAPCGGRTTKNSGYPRCELREMTAGGRRGASWSTNTAVARTLKARLAVTHTPRVKPHVVCAQIHDAENDVLMVRLEGTRLFVERSGADDVLLEKSYQTGTPFDLTITAANGLIRLWHNGILKMSWPLSRDGCYFKIGCYTQSNTGTGDAPQAYGEVAVSGLALEPAPDAAETTVTR